MLKKKLLVQEKFYRQAKFWRMVVAVLFLSIFLIAFRTEIKVLSDLITGVKFKNYFGPPPEILIRAFGILGGNLITMILLFFVFTLTASQFVLPVKTAEERSLVFRRLMRYFLNLHGPAVFINKGVAIADDKEMDNTRPGVAFVDLSSAIALESQWEHVETGKDLISRFRRSLLYRLAMKFSRSITQKLTNLLRSWFKAPATAVPLVRIAGPGIVFTNMNEKIRGIADLRRQARSADARINTRDGFEIQVPVSVVFSLGDRPEILYVTYDWDEAKGGWQQAARPSDLRVIKLNRARNKIEGLLDELDEDDAREIHQYVNSHFPNGSDHAEQFIGHDSPPYHFDSDRVFAALYSIALDAGDSTPLNWTELPVHVAVEHLRNLIAEQDYNALYRFNDPEQFPLYKQVLPDFKLFMRNQGVLAYQFVIRRDKVPFKIGDSRIKGEIAFCEPQDLKNSKVLRNRGIRVLGSGFSELTPRHAGIREQLVDKWRVPWEGEAKETATLAEMEAINTVAQSRGTAYREMISNLEMAYTGAAVPKDALALRLVQTLEQAIMDPKTQALLPKDGVSMLIELRNYFQPGVHPSQKDASEPRSNP